MIAYHHSERVTELPGHLLDDRLAEGWFRMHQDIFTTTHLFSQENIYRVHWLRYEVSAIADRPSHRRLRKLNAGFRVSLTDFSSIPDDHEELYSRYRASIDFEGADSVNHALFGEEAVRENVYQTKVISVYDDSRLIAGGYFDLGNAAAASILHFFDPAYARHSPGRFLMLATVDYLREQGFTMYYPGYVVAGKPKMNYKLFLGRSAATWFDPGTGLWRAFDDRILQAEPLSETDKLNIVLAFVE